MSQRISVAARLDRLPDSRYIRRLVILLSLGGCFEFYDLFFTAYIAPALYQSGIFTPTTKDFFGVGFASFIASLFAGLFVGTLLFSRMADHFGRRSIFSFSLLWYSAATLIMAVFSRPATAINSWRRFIAGIGIGVEFVTIDAYISELVPKGEPAARHFAFNEFLTFLAVLFVALVSSAPGSAPGSPLAGWVAMVVVITQAPLVEQFSSWFIRQGHPGVASVDRATRSRRRSRPGNAKNRRASAPRHQKRATTAGTGDGKRKTLRRQARVKAATSSATTVPPADDHARGSFIFSKLLVTTWLQATWAPTFLISRGVTVTKSLECTFRDSEDRQSRLVRCSAELYADKTRAQVADRPDWPR